MGHGGSWDDGAEELSGCVAFGEGFDGAAQGVEEGDACGGVGFGVGDFVVVDVVGYVTDGLVVGMRHDRFISSGV